MQYLATPDIALIYYLVPYKTITQVWSDKLFMFLVLLVRAHVMIMVWIIG